LSIRFPIALIVGALLSMVVFWALWRLVSAPVDETGMREATRIEFTRMRKDTEVASKREQKVEPPTPEVPRMAFSSGSVESNVAQITPSVDASGAMSKMSLSAGSDRDTIPLVRVPPDYPQRALSRGLEGWVQVQFTITGTGSVKDVVVVKSSSKVFEEAAVKSIMRWRYNPKIENGVAVDRVGVQTIIRFTLES
jgi:periplasmic protein TonB